MPSSVPSVGAASDWLRPIHCGNSLLPRKLPARNLVSSGQAPPAWDSLFQDQQHDRNRAAPIETGSGPFRRQSVAGAMPPASPGGVRRSCDPCRLRRAPRQWTWQALLGVISLPL